MRKGTVTLHNITAPNRRTGVFVDKRRPRGSPQIAIRFDMATINELRRRARDRKLPVAKIVREMVAGDL